MGKRISIRFRRATTDDAARLAELARRTYLDTFAADNEPGNIEAYVDEAFNEEQIRAELSDVGSTFLFAFDDERDDGSDEPIGYGKLRTGPIEPSVSGPDPIEIQRIYVDQRVLGNGVGAALMQALLDEAADSGHRTVWLGVWERNERAIRFYQRWGFEIVGDHVFRLGEDDQIDLIMQRSLP